MIVLSGVLVLVALVLLVIGIFGPLAAVYASIVASLAAAVLLAVAVYTRRGAPAAPPAAPEPVEPAPATGTSWLRDLSGDSEDRDRVPAVEPPRLEQPRLVPPPVAAPVRVDPPPEPDDEVERIVWVIDERPLYHRQGCQHLSDGEPIPLDAEEAREDGFVPCPVCRPDAQEPQGEVHEAHPVREAHTVEVDEVQPGDRAAVRAADVSGSAARGQAEPPLVSRGGSVPVRSGGPVQVGAPPPPEGPEVTAAGRVPGPPAEEVPVVRQPVATTEPAAAAGPDVQEAVGTRAVADEAPGADPDPDRDSGQERQQEQQREQERVRVALPAPPPPEEPPTGLVGRLLRRRR